MRSRGCSGGSELVGRCGAERSGPSRSSPSPSTSTPWCESWSLLERKLSEVRLSNHEGAPGHAGQVSSRAARGLARRLGATRRSSHSSRLSISAGAAGAIPFPRVLVAGSRNFTVPSLSAAATIHSQPSRFASASIRFHAVRPNWRGRAERLTWTPCITPARMASRSKAPRDAFDCLSRNDGLTKLIIDLHSGQVLASASPGLALGR
jgi:hypothetical protein